MDSRSSSPLSPTGSPVFSYPIDTPENSPAGSPKSNSPPVGRPVSASLRYSPVTLALAKEALDQLEHPVSSPSSSPPNRSLMLPDGSTVQITHRTSPSSSPPKGAKRINRPQTLPPKGRRSDGQKPEGEILSSSPPKSGFSNIDEKSPKPPRKSRENDPSAARSPPLSKHRKTSNPERMIPDDQDESSAKSPISRRKVSNPERLKEDRRGMSMANLFDAEEEQVKQPDFEKCDSTNPYDQVVVALEERHAFIHNSPIRMLQLRPSELLLRLSRGERVNELAGICYDTLTIDMGDEPVTIKYEEFRERNETHGHLYNKILETVYSGGNFAGNHGNEAIKDQVAFLFSESRFNDNYLTLKQIRERIPAYPLLQALSPVKGGIYDVLQLAMPILFPHQGREISKEVNRDGKSRSIFHTKPDGKKNCHVRIDGNGKATITQRLHYSTKVLVYQKNPLKIGEQDRSIRSTRQTQMEIGRLTIITSFVLDKITDEKEKDLPYLKINIHPRHFTCISKRAAEDKLQGLVTVTGTYEGDRIDPVDDEASQLIHESRTLFMKSIEQTLEPGKYPLPNGNIVRIEKAREKKK